MGLRGLVPTCQGIQRYCLLCLNLGHTYKTFQITYSMLLFYYNNDRLPQKFVNDIIQLISTND